MMSLCTGHSSPGRTSAPTHHQDQSSQTFSQGLSEKHVTNLEAPRQLVQNSLLSSHDAAVFGVVQSAV